MSVDADCGENVETPPGGARRNLYAPGVSGVETFEARRDGVRL